MNQNLRAFLDTIAVSELGAALLAKSDCGYNVIVGSTPANPVLFHSYADHPRRLVDLPELSIKSTAAGRYQILARYFDFYKKQLGLKDFSPASQDAIATKLIEECRAMDAIVAGRFSEALKKCRGRWASLPGAGYGQHENGIDQLQVAYIKAGGLLA